MRERDPSKAKRAWFQYRLRTLLVLVLLASVGMSCLATRMRAARQQRAAVEVIRTLGGVVLYDYTPQEVARTGRSAPSRPAWLRNLLGDDFFVDAVSVEFGPPEIRDVNVEQLKGLTPSEVTDRFWVTDGALKHLEWLPKLQRLRVNSFQVTDAGLRHLRGLTQLRELDLRSTALTDGGLDHLKRLTELRELQIDGTAITDSGLEKLKTLKRLEVLDIASTKISDAGLHHLAAFPQLRFLNVSDTGVTDAGLEHLKALTGLKMLWVLGTAATKHGVAELERVLPNCTVLY